MVEAHPHANAPVNAALSADDKKALLRKMVRIRRFEQTSLKYYQSGKMTGFLHLYIGQESVAVGAVSLMGEHDHVITAYRDHGHALAVGMGMNECMAELYGKVTGCSQGKGGSMHYFAPDRNYWGGHGIVGGQTPLGAGLAFALKYQGLKGCCMCFLGDGAVNQGAYHEALNLAGLWNLPVIYIIENNGYSMGTSQKRSSVYQECLAKRAEGYNIAWDVFNGEHIYEMRAMTQAAIDRAHHESRPTVLEVNTYRYYGHSVADSLHKKYRTKEEIERYQAEHDPIQVFSNTLIQEGIMQESDLEAMDFAAREEAEASARFAEESAWPQPDDIYKHIYAEVDNGSKAGQTGRHFFND